MKNRILIKNGTVVTMGSQGVIDSGFVLIEGPLITQVASMTELPTMKFDRVIDAGGNIVLPGLIDTHFHACQQLERGIFTRIMAEGKMKYPGWGHFLIPWESALSEEEVRLSAQAAYLNAVKLGTTCISEHGGRFPQILAETLEQVGLRGLVAMSTMDMDPLGIGIPQNMLFSTEEALAKGREIVMKWPFKGNGLARGVLSLRQILVCSSRLIQETLRLANQYQTMVQQHNNEGHYEIEYSQTRHGKRPAEYLESIGGLSPRVIAAHSVLMSDHEVEIFARNGVKVAHCPRGNFGGLGPTKLPLMRRLKVAVGVGSDGAVGGSIDLFEAMRISYVCQNLAFGTRYDDRSVTSTEEMLMMATIDGAWVVGLDKEIGSLEPGKKADLIIVDATDLNIQPSPDPISALVQCASGRNVITTIINGQVVMDCRQTQTMDEEAVKREVAQRAPEMQKRFLTRI